MKLITTLVIMIWSLSVVLSLHGLFLDNQIAKCLKNETITLQNVEFICTKTEKQLKKEALLEEIKRLK